MLEIALSAEAVWEDGTDWQALVGRAVATAVAATPYGEWLNSQAQIEISIRLTDDAEVQALNRDYRQKDRPTNVLSFPMIQPDLLDGVTANSDDGEVLLGDIVLAYGICAREAAARKIPIADHATHLIVHGTLHLLGYDHQDDREAEAMERTESDILIGLGLSDPYIDHPLPDED